MSATPSIRAWSGHGLLTLSVFEFVTDQLGSQGTVCAGYWYDGLIGQVGAVCPAVGWALGMERILELLKSAQLLPTQPAVDVFAVVPDASSGPWRPVSAPAAP